MSSADHGWPQPAQPPSEPTGPRRNPFGWLGAGVLGCVLAVVAVAFVVLRQGGGPNPLAEGSITLEPVDAPTPDPFMDENLDVGGAAGAGSSELGGLDDKVTAGLSGKVAAGDTVGLYGGSRDEAICDVARQTAFLTDPANEAKARAWAEVQGVEVDELASYLASLTPVRLRYDTRVTNHSFRDGKARPFQSVLQAGTAVLVDQTGVPRSKCFCGNPLGEPLTVEGEADETEAFDIEQLASNPEDVWEGFDPANVVTVQPSNAEAEVLAVIDLATGDETEIVAGSRYTLEQLEAALPSDADLGEYSDILHCPGGDSATCPPQDGDFAAVRGENSHPGYWNFGDTSGVYAVTWSDPSAKAQWLEDDQSDRGEYDGDFETPFEDLGTADGVQSFVPGRKGSGSMADYDAGNGWTGYILTSEYILLGPSNETSESVSETAIMVQRGSAAVTTYSVKPKAGQGATASRDDAERVLQGVLATLK